MGEKSSVFTGFLKKTPYILLGCVFVVLVILNLFWQDHWLDSDMAAEMIFSRLLAREGHIFVDRDWYYSTEFRFLYTHLLMGPLFRLTGSWHLIRAITNIAFYALMLASWFYAVKPLNLNRELSVLAGTILLLPFSETMMLHVQMGNTYMSHIILLFLAFGMFLRLSGKQRWGRVRYPVLLTCYLGLSVILGVSGVRYLLALECPLVLACVLYGMRSEAFAAFRVCMSREKLRAVLAAEEFRFLVYGGAGLAAALIGYGINAAFVSRHYVFQTYGVTNFISPFHSILLERIENAAGMLLLLFGYIPEKGFLSLRGLVSLCSFVLIGVLVWCVAKCRKRCRGLRLFWTDFVIVAFGLNLFVFVFTSSTMVSRYYLTILMFVLPLLAICIEEEKTAFDRAAVIVLLAGTLGLGTVKTVFSFVTVDKNEDRRPAAEFLAQNGYRFGFATYNNGNIVTELTNGQVEIANIGDPESLEFFRWSSPVRYYEAGYHDGACFLLLTSEEVSQYQDAEALSVGKKIYEDRAYTVYLYDDTESLLSCGGGKTP